MKLTVKAVRTESGDLLDEWGIRWSLSKSSPGWATGEFDHGPNGMVEWGYGNQAFITLFSCDLIWSYFVFRSGSPTVIEGRREYLERIENHKG